MKIIIQRVSSASVRVGHRVTGSIGKGYLVLVGAAQGDTEKDAEVLAEKTRKLRLFEHPPGKMNLSVSEVDGRVLVVSQFTLLARCNKGNRPSFDRAQSPDTARQLCDVYANRLRRAGVPVEEGEFGAYMEVSLVNDGPVTIILDSRELGKSAS